MLGKWTLRRISTFLGLSEDMAELHLDPGPVPPRGQGFFHSTELPGHRSYAYWRAIHLSF